MEMHAVRSMRGLQRRMTGAIVSGRADVSDRETKNRVAPAEGGRRSRTVGSPEPRTAAAFSGRHRAYRRQVLALACGSQPCATGVRVRARVCVCVRARVCALRCVHRVAYVRARMHHVRAAAGAITLLRTLFKICKNYHRVACGLASVLQQTASSSLCAQ